MIGFSILRKFSLRNGHFLQIRETFLPQKFPAIWYDSIITACYQCNISTARTDGALEMECFHCRHGARCISDPPSSSSSSEAEQLEQGNSVLLDNSDNREEEEAAQTAINCDCQHFKCAGLAMRKLCATDGATYDNECYMRKEACQTQKSIYKLYDGHCQLHCELVTLH